MKVHPITLKKTSSLPVGVRWSITEKDDKEKSLVRDIVHGDTKAMKTFFTTYSGYLTTVCSRYIADSDDVKDVLQDSFVKVFKSIGEFNYQGPGSLRAWATRIVVNESLKFLKKSDRLNIVSNPVWELPDRIEEEEVEMDDIPISVVLDMVRNLPTGYKTVFNLYIFEKKSHKEIAAMLNITENTSASQLHRAKSLLAKQIEGFRSVKRLAL